MTKKFFTFIALIHFLLNQLNVYSQIKKPLIYGETISFRSKILEEERTVNIYLPPSYGISDTVKYPVIYLLDGSIDEDFIHVSGLVQFANFAWINMIPESIVVGISNVDRKRDFTFPTSVTKDKEDFPTTGSSGKFISFLEEELKPLILKTYAINDTSTLIGQSLGGLLATEILFKKPQMFNNYIIVSPSLWWDGGSLLHLTPRENNEYKKIFIAVGKEDQIMIDDAKSLYTNISKIKNYQSYFKFLQDQDHGDALHLAVYWAFDKSY